MRYEMFTLLYMLQGATIPVRLRTMRGDGYESWEGGGWVMCKKRWIHIVGS